MDDHLDSAKGLAESLQDNLHYIDDESNEIEPDFEKAIKESATKALRELITVVEHNSFLSGGGIKELVIAVQALEERLESLEEALEGHRHELGKNFSSKPEF